MKNRTESPQTTARKEAQAQKEARLEEVNAQVKAIKKMVQAAGYEVEMIERAGAARTIILENGGSIRICEMGGSFNTKGAWFTGINDWALIGQVCDFYQPKKVEIDTESATATAEPELDSFDE